MPANHEWEIYLNYVGYLRLDINISSGSSNVMRQRRSQDFFFGGATRYIFVTSPVREPTAFSGGGGGRVAEMFRDLNYRIGFSGGGVVAEIFRDLYYRIGFSGGGVVAVCLHIQTT